MNDTDMSRFDFNDILKDVTAFFIPPKDTRALEILYDMLKVYPYAQVKQACRFLIEHHDGRFFPNPRDFKDALREVAELRGEPRRIYATPEEYYADHCDICGGTGMWVEDRQEGEYKYSVAVYCSCERGRMMRRNKDEYMRRYHGPSGYAQGEGA